MLLQFPSLGLFASEVFLQYQLFELKSSWVAMLLVVVSFLLLLGEKNILYYSTSTALFN